MSPRRSKIIVRVSVFALIGICGFLGYQDYQLHTAKKSLESQIVQLNRKMSALKRKYAEEKARVAAVQRAKLAVEAQKREAELKLATLKKENQELLNSQNNIEEQLQKRTKRYETKIARLTEHLSEIKSQLKEMKTRLKTASKTIAKRDAEVDRMSEEIQSLEADIETKRREIERVRGHNKNLVTIAEEILLRYEQKGTGQIILHKEPLTQLKKVEFEHLRQEYLDKIDKEALVEE
jgi:chromosome segregation ATPase